MIVLLHLYYICDMKKALFFSMFAFAVMCASCGNGSNAVSNTSQADTLGIMSFNIRNSGAKFEDGKNCWDNRREAVAGMIAGTAPVMIGLQEMLPDQVDFLDARLDGYMRIGVGRDDGIRGGEMMAVYYDTAKVDLIDGGTFWLSQTPDTVSRGWDAACNRTVTWGRFVNKDSGNEFFFFNTHLDHMGQTARQEGVKLVKDRIRQIAGDMPAVLCGDMNSDSDDPIFTPLQGYMQLARTACADTDTMRTYNGYGKVGGSRIDHVFFKGVEPLRFSVMDEDYGVPYISDHYPVCFDFVLKGGENMLSAGKK